MSRWKSPETAAKRAALAAKEAEKVRKLKRISWLLALAVALASIGLMVADYFFLRYAARKRHERIHPDHRRGTNALSVQTNRPNETIQKSSTNSSIQ